jgi:HprK-related kinase A
MLHAAVVEKNGHVIIFPAAPGSGKSTLSACLMLSGWNLFSDEFALLSKDIDTITPFGRPVSLKNESIDVIENKFNLKVNSLVTGTAKGDVAHLMHHNIIKNITPVKIKNIWLVFPKYNRGAKTSLTPLSPAQAFIPLVEQSFNYNQLGVDGFKSAKTLIDKSKKYNFEYSNIDEAIHLFNKLVAN